MTAEENVQITRIFVTKVHILKQNLTSTRLGHLTCRSKYTVPYSVIIVTMMDMWSKESQWLEVSCPDPNAMGLNHGQGVCSPSVSRI